MKRKLTNKSDLVLSELDRTGISLINVRNEIAINRTELSSDLVNVKTDLSNEIVGVKNDTDAIKIDVSTFKKDLYRVKTEMAKIESKVEIIETRNFKELSQVKGELVIVNEKADTNQENIARVGESIIGLRSNFDARISSISSNQAGFIYNEQSNNNVADIANQARYQAAIALSNNPGILFFGSIN